MGNQCKEHKMSEIENYKEKLHGPTIYSLFLKIRVRVLT